MIHEWSRYTSFLNNSNILSIGKYILDDSDCTSLAKTIATTNKNVLIDNLPLIIIAVSIVTVAIVTVSVFIYYHNELQVWIFGQCGVRLYHSAPSSDKENEKRYDTRLCNRLLEPESTEDIFRDSSWLHQTADIFKFLKNKLSADSNNSVIHADNPTSIKTQLK